MAEFKYGDHEVEIKDDDGQLKIEIKFHPSLNALQWDVIEALMRGLWKEIINRMELEILNKYRK